MCEPTAGCDEHVWKWHCLAAATSSAAIRNLVRCWSNGLLRTARLLPGLSICICSFSSSNWAHMGWQLEVLNESSEVHLLGGLAKFCLWDLSLITRLCEDTIYHIYIYNIIIWIICLLPACVTCQWQFPCDLYTKLAQAQNSMLLYASTDNSRKTWIIQTQWVQATWGLLWSKSAQVQVLSQLRLVRVIDLSPSLFKPLVLLLQINLQWGRNTQHGRGQQSANAHSCD